MVVTKENHTDFVCTKKAELSRRAVTAQCRGLPDIADTYAVMNCTQMSALETITGKQNVVGAIRFNR